MESILSNLRKNSVLAACAASASICFLVLVGWQFEIEFLKSVLPSFISMKVNTAIGGILLSGAIACLRRGDRASTSARVASAVFALLALSIGLATLAEYQLNLNFGIDEFFFKDVGAIRSGSPGGRLSPATALCFIFLAASALTGLLPASRSMIKYSQGAAFLAFLLSFQGIVGYLIGFHYNFGNAYYARIAVHTAVFVNCLSLAALGLYPNQGFVSG